MKNCFNKEISGHYRIENGRFRAADQLQKRGRDSRDGREGELKLKCDKGEWWGGGAKTDCWSGCGIVVKGVDKYRWVTVSEIAVPLKKECGALEV